MPYGSTMRRANGRPYRRRRAYRRRAKGPSVVKKTRVPLARKSTVMRNARAIRQLKMSQYGAIQKGFHRISNHVVPIQRSPVLFNMFDFSVNHVSGAGTAIPSGPFYQVNGGALQAVATWDRAQFVTGNPYWLDEYADTPDTGKIFETYMDYTFAIEGSGGLDETRVRIDIFYQRSNVLYARAIPGGTLLLPGALTHMDNIATPELNQISPKYFKKIYTKVVYFNSRTDETVPGISAGTTQFTPNKRYVRFRMKPNKLIQQVLTNPTAQGGPEAVLDNGSWNQLNVPVNQQLWCLISTDDQSALTGDAVHVNVSRRVSWRDPLGSAGLGAGTRY